MGGYERRRAAEEAEGEMSETTEPSHIQISALADNKCGWTVWFYGDEDPRDRDGIADSLEAALERIKEVIHAQ